MVVIIILPVIVAITTSINMIYLHRKCGKVGCAEVIWYGKIYQGSMVLKVVAKWCGMVGYF